MQTELKVHALVMEGGVKMWKDDGWWIIRMPGATQLTPGDAGGELHLAVLRQDQVLNFGVSNR